MTKIAAENEMAPRAGDAPLRGRCVGCSLPLAIHPSECPGPWRPPPCETDVPTPITHGDYGRLVRMPDAAWDDAPYRSRLREAWDEMHPGEP